MKAIHIPKPCHENWNAMTPNELGRHCSVCSTTVVDFTQKTDEEIIDFLQSTKQKVCGRIKHKQKVIAQRQGTKWWWKAKIAAAGIAVIMSFGEMYGQNTETIYPHLGIGQVLDNKRKAVVELSGAITDKETGEVLPFVSVYIPELEIGAITDFDGKFTIVLPEMPDSGITLIASSIEYKADTLHIPASAAEQDLGDIQIQLQLELSSAVIQVVVVKVGKLVKPMETLMGTPTVITTIKSPSKESVFRMMDHLFVR